MKKEELQTLRKKLPRNSYSKIAAHTGLSKRTVQAVWSGQHQNSKVIDFGLELILKEEEKEKARQQKIAQIL